MTKRPMGLMTTANDSEQSTVEKLGGIEAEDFISFWINSGVHRSTSSQCDVGRT